MSDNGLVKIGYDPGFSANKMAWVVGETIETYSLPSSVGEPNRSSKDGLTLAGVMRPRRRAAGGQPLRVEFNGIEYLAGPGVSDVTEPIDRLDFNRFSDSPELRATFYATIYRAVNGGSHRAALAIALPVEVVQDDKEAHRVEQAMRGWLVGEHHFSVDGVETALTVTSVRAKIPQPVATWFDWGFNAAGQWIRGKAAQKAPTLIIDSGFNTLDVLVIQGGQISRRFSDGETLGMRRAAERLIKAVKTDYDGLELELARANDLIQAGVNRQPVEIYVHGQPTDISRLAQRALQSLEAEAHNYLDRTLGRGKVEYQVLLTGGGTLALSGMLLRQFPRATVMPEPVLANARGLAKLAVRPGFLG